MPSPAPDWNESLSSNFLWSNVNFGEAVSEVMTPFTWSMLRDFRSNWVFVKGVMPFGRIGGRLYLNASYYATILNAIGKNRQQIIDSMQASLHIPIPAGMQIPAVPLNPLETLYYLGRSAAEQLRWAITVARLPGSVAANPGWCRRMRQVILSATSPGELRRVWQMELRPHLHRLYLGVLSSAMRSTMYSAALHLELATLTGADQADVLTSNLSSDEQLLTSLGVSLGIWRVAQGQMSPEDYLEQYGHRCTNEWEVFARRPLDDPLWLERQLADARQANVDAGALLARQRQNFASAWRLLEQRHPSQAPVLHKKINEAARRTRLREAARSELVRAIAVLHRWALRAGELSAQGEKLAMLEIEEVASVLSGDLSQAQATGERLDIYTQYSTLPPYPALIKGHFDPFAWAADPQRSLDIFDDQPESLHLTSEEAHPLTIHGSPGSTGIVEGRVRLIASLDQGASLQPGEVLVTSLTDIGWTPLFPRAAAIVTDVGAALSHAAIVARELGIPAVVGCRDATRRLRTGDLVRVDGARGRVEILT